MCLRKSHNFLNFKKSQVPTLLPLTKLAPSLLGEANAVDDLKMSRFDWIQPLRKGVGYSGSRFQCSSIRRTSNRPIVT